ncbi:hypothetical protein RUM43_009590 [Polyplax serrata]|uniref:Uncharacterized protein n=1 Tax=Polyplax serrata TaxID=468196 RepID=A0AAN8PDA1_POLSC
MTDLKDLYGTEVEQEKDDISFMSLMSTSTVEDILAKYLMDFAIEEDYVLGYINDLNTFREILKKMRDLGFAFSVRDSDARRKQREKVRKVPVNDQTSDGEGGNDLFSHLTVFYQLKAMHIKFFGLPFTIDKTTHYQCAYGCKYYKSRAGSTKLKAENTDLKQTKKKKRVGSKKMGCLAKMTIKHITVYPDYKLDMESDWRKKKKLIENLRRDLSDDSKIVSQFQRFYLSVSLQSSHNHPPIIIKPKLKIQKPKSNKVLLRGNRLMKTVRSEGEEEKEEIGKMPLNPEPENSWNCIELATSSFLEEQEGREEIPVKMLSLKDDSFFQTLVKFPTTSGLLEQVEGKQKDIKIEIKAFEPTENMSTIEVYEYQPTIQELQTLFKEKLKNLYTLCTNCTNGALILRLAGYLEQVEMELSKDVNYSNL